MKAFEDLEQGVYTALETYSNVHRGSGHNSMVTTHLFEQARDIVLEYLGLKKGRYIVLFCTPERAEWLRSRLKAGSYKSLSSKDFGLSLGIRALAVEKKALPKGTPFQTGGGTSRLVSADWIIWAKAPGKFEAGTPAIINIIAFARALLLSQHSGNGIFLDAANNKMSAAEILYHDELDEYSGSELLDILRKTLVGHNIYVPTVDGNRPYINLDNGASTPTFTPIWNAVRQTWQQSSQVQQEIINEVRHICARVLNAPLSVYDMIFTSNTTEAINITGESLSRQSEEEIEPVILNTLLEHNSNDLPWRMVQDHSLIRITVDTEGFVDLNELEILLYSYNKECQYGKKRIRLVAVSGASNVLGVFNNLTEISRIVHKFGTHILVDAAQMVAHRKVDIEGTGIDYLAFSAHKVYAPFGCGVLIARKGLLNFNPAELELIQLSGEENAGGIAALGKALVLLERIGPDLIREEEQALTARALRGMAQIPGLRIFGIKDPESPQFAHKGGVIVFDLKNIFPNKVAKELAERGGIGVRYGCHCSHLLIKHLINIPPFLERFQRLLVSLFPGITLPGLTRVSLGLENSQEDIDTFVDVLGKIAQQPRLPATNIKKQINNFVMDAARRVYSL